MDEKKKSFDDAATFADLANKYLKTEDASVKEEILPGAEEEAPQVSPPDPKIQKNEIYFSNQFHVPEPKPHIAGGTALNNGSAREKKDLPLSPENKGTTEESQLRSSRSNRSSKQKAPKKAKKKFRINIDTSRFTKNTYIFFGIVIALSVIVSIYAVFCVNDILALTKNKNPVSVSVSANDIEDVDSVINMLHDNRLINCPLFCKIFVRVRSSMFVKTSKGPIEYTQGTFELNPKMGLEGLLVTLQGEVAEKETVQLTFPEGYTVGQIIDVLVKNEVCSEEALRAELEKASFAYSILNDMTDNEQIAFKYEGYLFPDTYEFYQGENPNSVIEKFVKALDENFTQELRQKAAEQNMSIAEVLTLASIIQQEAANNQQMPLVSSILHNRLNNPQTYPILQCDSTYTYLDKLSKSLTVNSKHNAEYYKQFYDSYSKQGLPVGPICNPGMSAIEAALNPEQTDYFFFLHDSEGNIHTARTYAEQRQNQAKYNVGV